MKHTCRCLQILGGLLANVMIVGILVTTAFAQNDLQIIVNGPWSYVAQGDTLFLVAPGNSGHCVYIYAGIDPSSWPKSSPPLPNLPCGMLVRPTGTYTIGFEDAFQPGTPANVPLAAPMICPATVRNTTSVINNSSNANYVIALPMPDAFSTYEDLSYTWDGYSESKVSNQPIDHATQSTLYTTTMVLHYWAKDIPSELTLNKPGTIKTTGPGDNRPTGITIVSGSLDKNPSHLKCDDVSLDSIHERNALWRINQYALFPEEVDLLGHQSHHYRFPPDCPSMSPGMHRTTTLDAQSAELCKKFGGVVKDNLCLHSTGSADCHACQMSINGAVN